MIRTSYHQVALDTLILSERHPVPQPGGYHFTVQAQGFNLGRPVPVQIALSSLMQDGDLVRKLRDGNRQIQLRVTIHGKDDAELALGESALYLAINASTEMRWTPPSGVGEMTVFDVLAGEMEYEADDMEMLAGRWTFVVTLTCMPFGRPETPVVQAFTAGTANYGVVDAASSTSGWSAYGATLTTSTVGGDTCILATANSSEVVTVTRAATDLGATTYYAIDVRVESGNGSLAAYIIPGALAVTDSPISSLYRRYFYLRPAGGASITLSFNPTNASHSYPQRMYIGGVYSATNIPTSTVSIVDVQGSARSPGSISFTRGGSVAILYADSTMLSHGWIPNDPTTWNRCPSGTYALWDGTDGITGDVSTIALNDKQGTGSVRIIAGAIARPRGTFVLGAGRNGRAGTLSWKKSIGGAALDLTGCRLFRVADVDAEYGPSSIMRAALSSGSLVQIDVPSREFPRGGVWLDGVDITDKCASWEWPIIGPGPTALYVEGAANPNMTLTYYPRFHTHVARAS